MKTLLLVDDLAAERRLLYHALKSDYRVLEADRPETALDVLRQEPVDLVVLDLHLPPNLHTAEEGLRLERSIRELSPSLPIVIATGDQDHELALELVRRGVADFLLKPIDPKVLSIVVVRALERAQLQDEVDRLRAKVRERYSFGNLVGSSPAMQEVFDQLQRLAAVKSTILLRGESGTGKSAVARAIHHASPRRDGPFVVVDGASIPESLVESELFGHVKGAFTGADTDKLGHIRAADGGTLFLDEIGNLSPSVQAKLLLFLDDQRCTPVGSGEATSVDARMIAATNQDLGKMVTDGGFRSDLLYRLSVAEVNLPPLRERREDIPALAEHLLARLHRDAGLRRVRLAADALDLLRGFDWPGNVRQLCHVLESSVVLSDSDVLDAASLTLPSGDAVAAPGDLSTKVSLKQSIADYEKRLVLEALEASGGNKVAAGRALGLDENQIRYLCRKHGLP